MLPKSPALFGTSILENLVDMDVNVPPILIKGLKVASEKIDAAAKMGDGENGE